MNILKNFDKNEFIRQIRKKINNYQNEFERKNSYPNRMMNSMMMMAKIFFFLPQTEFRSSFFLIECNHRFRFLFV